MKTFQMKISFLCVVLVLVSFAVFMLVLLLKQTRFSSLNVQLHTDAALDGRAVQRQTKRRRVIVLLGYHRSGSSFTGDILNLHPDVFYLYEPLRRVFSLLQHENRDFSIGGALDRHAVNFLRKMLHCAFDEMPLWWLEDSYDKSTCHLCRSRVITDFLGCTNLSLTLKKDKCNFVRLAAADLSRMCKSKTVAVKIIRSTLPGALASLMDDPSLDVKVIHLVRDPRGIVSSINRIPASSPDHIPMEKVPHEAERMCRRIKTNVEGATLLPKKNYFLLHYEDLAINPRKVIKQLYDFAGLAASEEFIARFVEQHSQNQDRDAYSTARRNSTLTALAWMKHLPKNVIEEVEQKCQSLLKVLGYKTVF